MLYQSTVLSLSIATMSSTLCLYSVSLSLSLCNGGPSVSATLKMEELQIFKAEMIEMYKMSRVQKNMKQGKRNSAVTKTVLVHIQNRLASLQYE